MHPTCNASVNALNVGLNALLIPRWGIYGAAIATAAALTVLSVVRGIELHRLVGVTPPWPRMARIAGAFVLAAVPVGVLRSAVDAPLMGAAASAAVFAVACPCALWAVGMGPELTAAWTLLRGGRGAREAAIEGAASKSGP